MTSFAEVITNCTKGTFTFLSQFLKAFLLICLSHLQFLPTISCQNIPEGKNQTIDFTKFYQITPKPESRIKMNTTPCINNLQRVLHGLKEIQMLSLRVTREYKRGKVLAQIAMFLICEYNKLLAWIYIRILSITRGPGAFEELTKHEAKFNLLITSFSVPNKNRTHIPLITSRY